MHNEAVWCAGVDPHAEASVSCAVSRTRCRNLVDIKLAAEQASRGFQIREIVCHFLSPEKVAGRHRRHMAATDVPDGVVNKWR